MVAMSLYDKFMTQSIQKRHWKFGGRLSYGNVKILVLKALFGLHGVPA